MKRYLLDTGIMGLLINRRGNVPTRVAAATQAGFRVGTSLPVVGELYSGVACSTSSINNLARLERALHAVYVWPFDLASAREFGRLFGELRRIGRPMQQIDIQTAAIAFTLGDCTVVTMDSDFQAIPGLSVEDWSI